MKPTPSSGWGNALSLDEADSIQAGVMAGESNAEIARQIGRHRSTVGEELKRNGGPRRGAGQSAPVVQRVERSGVLMSNGDARNHANWM